MRALIAICLLTLGCGKTVPAGGVPRADASAPQVVTEATDLVPQDLDLVMRVDLSKVRSTLGAELSRELIEKAADQSGADGLARSALAAADVVWLGTRLADAEAGDRVLVVHTERPSEGEGSRLEPDTISWEKRGAVGDVRRFVARVPPRREGTARVYLFGDRDAVFVSPVEAMSVERVLRRGPDPRRGQPEARGLFSLDYRASRLSPDLERRFPSLAGLWQGIERVRAIVDVAASGLELDARILCRNPRAAEKVHRFLGTIRDTSVDSGRTLFEDLSLEQSGATVLVRWPLPAAVIAELLASTQTDEPRPSSDEQDPPPDPSETLPDESETSP